MKKLRNAIVKAIAEGEKAIAANDAAREAAYVADITNAELKLKLMCLDVERSTIWSTIDKLHDALAQLA